MTREEAINEIKSWDFLNEKESEAVRTLIPELRESEDERIRQKLVWLLQQDICPFPEEEATKMIAYLEKQKEQKPAEWSEEDERMITRICANLEYLVKEAGSDSILKEKLEERIKWMKRLKSLRPSWKPSEEQMNMLKCTLDYYGSHAPKELVSLYEDLKKL